MGVLLHKFDKGSFLHLGSKEIAEKKASVISGRNIAEIGWGACTFILFLMLGPFSAIAAMGGLASLAKDANQVYPESIN